MRVQLVCALKSRSITVLGGCGGEGWGDPEDANTWSVYQRCNALIFWLIRTTQSNIHTALLARGPWGPPKKEGHIDLNQWGWWRWICVCMHTTSVHTHTHKKKCARTSSKVRWKQLMFQSLPCITPQHWLTDGIRRMWHTSKKNYFVWSPTSIYMHPDPFCSTLTAGLSVTKPEHFQSKLNHFQFKWVGEQWPGQAASPVSCTLHVKELRPDLYTVISLLRLPRAALRRDFGPEMLVSVALLVAFKRTRQF